MAAFCNNFSKEHVLYDLPNHTIRFDKDFAYANYTLGFQKSQKQVSEMALIVRSFDATLRAGEGNLCVAVAVRVTEQ